MELITNIKAEKKLIQKSQSGLSAKEEKKLIQKSQSGCRESRNKLFEHNYLLIKKTVNKFKPFLDNYIGVEYRDLFSEAVEAFIRSINQINLEKYRLITYSSYRMRDTLRNYLFQNINQISMPKSSKMRIYYELNKINKDYEKSRNYIEKDKQIQKLGKKYDTDSKGGPSYVIAIQDSIKCKSINGFTDSKKDRQEERKIEEAMAKSESITNKNNYKKKVNDLKDIIDESSIGDRDSKIIKQVVNGKKDAQIAKDLNISRPRVTFIKNRSIKKIADYFVKESMDYKFNKKPEYHFRT